MDNNNVLTKREREVHNKIVEGKSNAEIACELVISINTVKNHVHRILEKMELSSRNEVIALHCRSLLAAMERPDSEAKPSQTRQARLPTQSRE